MAPASRGRALSARGGRKASACPTKCSTKAGPLPADECPGWWLHWSQPERESGFCSACGSRAQSRRKLTTASAVLQQQVDVLSEIYFRQQDDIKRGEVERAWTLEDLKQRAAAVAKTEPAEQGRWEQRDLEEKIAAEKAKIDRLRRELEVWRSSEGGSPRAGVADVPTEEEHVAERHRWRSQTAAMEAELEDLRARCKRVVDDAEARKEGSLSNLAAGRVEAARIVDDLRRLPSAPPTGSGASPPLTASQREDERRAQQQLAAQSEERSLLERKLQVEAELREAQESQLRSVKDAIAAVKEQLQTAQCENTELRAALQRNQDTLRRLRQ
eukprot:TRINITY_DN3107_c0_g1_i5.p1 TRINITY_DN3107_c0_g1~~TRINITY_DN3107_c0_g1_i5.p1  ORF type:complete len:329 (-),score=86.87 TRINITY_DN3107_c0_g1_i5:82-1068(-)